MPSSTCRQQPSEPCWSRHSAATTQPLQRPHLARRTDSRMNRTDWKHRQTDGELKKWVDGVDYAAFMYELYCTCMYIYLQYEAEWLSRCEKWIACAPWITRTCKTIPIHDCIFNYSSWATTDWMASKDNLWEQKQNVIKLKKIQWQGIILEFWQEKKSSILFKLLLIDDRGREIKNYLTPL